MKYPERHKIHAGCPGIQAAASAVCLSTSGRHDLRPRPDHRRPDDPHPEALTRRYHYYDPIYTLDDEGQRWWRAKIAAGVDELLSELQLEQGITVDA